MNFFLTEPEVMSKHHKQWFISGTTDLIKSKTDFYIARLFGPDADEAAKIVGLREGLRSKQGIWAVPSKTVFKVLMKLGAELVTNNELEEHLPDSETSNE